jgi:GntR family transcriptional regulator/MocR family aminotransferase
MKTMSAAILPIITIDRKSSRPLHQQIYDAYRAAIADGTLRPAQMVPATRVLAGELGVSRIPVLHAYAQLVAEGYFQSWTGRGTQVSQALPERPKPSGPVSADSRKAALGLPPLPNLAPLAPSAVWRRDRGAFVVGQVSHDLFPFRVWNALLLRHGRRAAGKLLEYGDGMGLKELREAIAVYLRTARGVKCEGEQIMVVSGSQQALQISARALLEPGHRVWIEEPGYQFARNVFALHRCRIVPVPVDNEGLDVAAGIRQWRNARAALVTPSHQYPLGATMSASRRFQLLDWAERCGAWILEDDYDSEYRYEVKPIAALQGLDRNSRVIYIGTFSKVLFPSMRLGYVVIPTDLIERFLAIRIAMDIAPPTLSQAVLADFIREGHFSRHIRRMRMIYGERRSKLIESLRKEMPFEMEVTGGQAGIQLAVTLSGINDIAIAVRAAHQKLWLWPLSLSYAGEASRQGFILGFGSVSLDDIPKAVRKLRAVMGLR